MPRYEIEHVCPLTEAQKDELAQAVTKIHSDSFGTPKFFVNLRITDINEHAVYLAGKRRKNNRIFAYARAGPSRKREDFDEVSRQLVAAWDKIVPLPQTQRSQPKPDTELRLVMFFGAITAGYEGGFMVPPAGEDKQWLADNLHAFKARAEAGDDEFREMIQECEARGLVSKS